MRRTARGKRTAELSIGDRVRILRIPGMNIAGYLLHPQTKRAYEMLIARGRSVRICRIDKDGLPWFNFRIKQRSGTWEYHSMCITQDDNNWVQVKHRCKGNCHA
jgi:hypothetical protein